MFSNRDRQTLQHFLDQQAVILTANRRLQRSLTPVVTPGLWQAMPAIHAAEDWIRHRWDELQDLAWPGTDRTPVTQFQSCRIWQQIIEADAAAPPLISPAQLARRAEAAAQLLDEWEIDIDSPAFEERQEYQCFRRWYRLFQEYLTDHSLADGTYIRRSVQSALENGALPRHPLIVLYGFDDLAPRLRAIFGAAALDIEHWQTSPAPDSTCVRTRAPDSESEIRAAALWSRARIEAEPARRVAVVVPQLASWRPTVERIFTEVYETGTWLPAEPRRTPPFNFSAGTALASTPLVADALLLLSLDQKEVDTQKLRRLLLSPFWQGSAGHDSRALLHYLNASPRTRLALADVRRQAQRSDNEGSNSLASILNMLVETARRHPRQQSYTRWAQFFAGQLQTCGWPGSRTLDSTEYQQLTRFRELLDQLSQCDASLRSPVGCREALQCLTELAESTSFQAHTQTSPVQILGLLEAAGLEFDGCWVMDLADVTWPPPAKPNPFLPLQLQVRLGLPRSSAERELNYARALTERLRQSAQETVFSWPASEGEVELQPSRLIADFYEVPVEALAPDKSPLATYSETIGASSQFEWVDCQRGPAWADLTRPLPGGTGALKLQALCPFNAFAVYRLGAFPRERPCAGLNPAERGVILHELMAGLWNELKDQKTLRELSEPELEELIAGRVEATLTPWRRQRDDVLHPRYFRLEQQRLCKLAGSWLKLEAERPPFDVAAVETRAEIRLPAAGGMATLRGRIDRIDRLASGKLLVIDYKTGNASTNQWLGERPTDLQLPLYALSQGDQVTGITFAELSPKRVAFSGMAQLTAEDGEIAGIVSPDKPRGSNLPPDWTEALAAWQSAARTLLDEFLAGHCEAINYNRSQARFYAHLEPLNRTLDDTA